MPERWQYATMLRDPDGALFDLYTSGSHDLASATAAAKEWNEEEGDSPDVCVVVRRTPPVAAGEWTEVTARYPGREQGMTRLPFVVAQESRDVPDHEGSIDALESDRPQHGPNHQ